MKNLILAMLLALVAAFCGCSSSSGEKDETTSFDSDVYTKVVKRVGVDVFGHQILVLFQDNTTKMFVDFSDLLYVAMENDTIAYRENAKGLAKCCKIRFNDGNFNALEDSTTVYAKMVKRRVSLMGGDGKPIEIVRFEDNSFFGFFSQDAYFVQLAQPGDSLQYKHKNLQTRECVAVSLIMQ